MCTHVHAYRGMADTLYQLGEGVDHGEWSRNLDGAIQPHCMQPSPAGPD